MLPHPLEIFKIDIFNEMNMYSQIFKSSPPPLKKSILINNGVTKLKKFVLGVWTTLIYKQPFQIELNVSDLKKSCYINH